jgi:5-methylcytosine-specific restriction enzyme A
MWRGVSFWGKGVVKLIDSRVGMVGRRVAMPEKSVDPFYLSQGWRQFASVIKAQRGWQCEACKADMSSNRRACHADHVIERRDGGADFDPLNIAVLCQACHNGKTWRAKLARMA